MFKLKELCSNEGRKGRPHPRATILQKLLSDDTSDDQRGVSPF